MHSILFYKFAVKAYMAESGGFEPHWFHPAHRFQDESVTLTVHSPNKMAEQAGFEPADELPRRLISNQLV